MEQPQAKFLTSEQRNELMAAHRHERQRHYADRIKAILLLDDSYSVERISRILLLDESTIRRYLASYQQGGLSVLTNDNYQPYAGKLDHKQEVELGQYLDDHLYSEVSPIIS